MSSYLLYCSENIIWRAVRASPLWWRPPAGPPSPPWPSAARSVAATNGIISTRRFDKLKLQGSTNRRALGLVNLVPALAYHFCLNLPAELTQPRARLLVEPCTEGIGYCDYHLVTNIRYCDYHLVTNVGYCDNLPTLILFSDRINHIAL